LVVVAAEVEVEVVRLVLPPAAEEAVQVEERYTISLI
jgi:hypothetical protein